jgi:hypothetical protein
MAPINALSYVDVSKQLTCSTDGPAFQGDVKDAANVCKTLVPDSFEIARTAYVLPDRADDHGCLCIDWVNKGHGFRACNCNSCDRLFAEYLNQICILVTETCQKDMGMPTGILRDVAANAVYIGYNEGMSLEATNLAIDDRDEFWTESCKNPEEARKPGTLDYTGVARKGQKSEQPGLFCFLRLAWHHYGVSWDIPDTKTSKSLDEECASHYNNKDHATKSKITNSFDWMIA